MINYINFKMGQHLENKKQWKKAFTVYQKIAKNSKKIDPLLAYRLGFTSQKIGNLKEATNWLLEAVKAAPHKSHWCLRLGKVAIASGNAKAAQAAYAQGGLEVFTDAAWHFALGQLLEKAKDYPQAAHFYAQAWDFNPQQANYAYRLGRAHQQSQDYDSAIAAYRQALALAPNHADTLICLARSLQEAQQPEQAAPVFRQLLALDGADADKHRHTAHYQLGCILAGQGQHSAALQSLGAALQLQPQHAPSWLAQARSQQALGQYPQALNSLVQACAVQPKHTAALLALAQLRMCNGPFAGAAQVWEQLLAQQPTNTHWLQQHALALDMAGRQPAAIAAYQKLHAQLLIEEKHQTTHKTPINQAQNAIDSEVISAAAVDSYITAYGHLRDKNYPLAQNSFRQALEQAGALAPAHWHYRLAQALHLGGLALAAEAPIQQAMALQPGYTYYAAQFALIIRKQNRTWQEVEALQHTLAVAQNPANPNPNLTSLAQWQWELGEAQDKMNRFAEAASAYQQANQAQPGDALKHFTEGYAWERAGDAHQAAQAYAAAIAADQTLGAAQWGIGVFHQERGFWAQAALAYASQLQRQPDNAQLHYRLGLAHERCYAWQAAVDSYCQALAIDIHQPECHYHLGFVYERLGRWSQAAQAYQQAVMRAEKHESLWYYRLGYVLEQQGQYQQACAAFKHTRLLQLPHGVLEDPLRNQGVRTAAIYLECVETLPLAKEIILYESFNGTSLTCNPLALFQALLAHPDYQSFLHVWVLNDKARIPAAYRALPNVIFVSKGSDGYLRYLATAQYLINNSGFPPYFVRRDGQKYLATWHGTPLKTLGKEQKYKFYDHNRTQRNFLQASHIISPNPHTSAIQLDSYDIRPIYTGLYAETGYPRVDLTLNTTESEKAALRERMGLTADRPIVLYAPTWRGTLQDVAFDTERLENDLSALTRLDCQFIFRGHSLMESVLQTQSIGCQVVPPDIDSNALLSIVDVLITDYSSIFFDFLATGRPIIYYIYDVEEYEQERGLYFSMQDMPGIKCSTIDELCAGIKQALNGDSSNTLHYQEAQKLYNLHDDGHATDRVIDFFFHDQTSHAIDFNPEDKPAVIFHAGGFEPNGITASAINLIQALDRNDFHLVLAMAPDRIEKSPLALQQFAKLPKDIYTVPRYGSMPMTLEERWVRIQTEEGGLVSNPTIKKILETAFAREFRRIFGNKKYASVVAFSGYDDFFGAVLNINNFPMRKLIYLHNDMLAEYHKRFYWLARIFNLYQYADYLISVSEQTNQLNKKQLFDWPGVNPEKFVHCDNVINAANTIKLAELPLEQAHDTVIFDSPGIKFITMGRLSIEKDHEKLIHAFAKIHAKHPDAQLLILGDGPLRGQLDVLVAKLQLADCVHLLGYRSNPYNYLRRADCFILSSNHEGQPMTLLESLILRKPIIATDIVGNRSVLEGRGGLLVENSIDGLINGFDKFISQGIDLVPFNAEEYNKSALNNFFEKVLSK